MNRNVKIDVYAGDRAPTTVGRAPVLWVDTGAEPPVFRLSWGGEWKEVGSPAEVPEPPSEAATKAQSARKSKYE